MLFAPHGPSDRCTIESSEVAEMSDIVDYFTRSDVVHIATELKGGGEVVTPIWGVVVDGVPYIRSGYAREVVSPEVRRLTMRLTPRRG
jgi:hypothetical protein